MEVDRKAMAKVYRLKSDDSYRAAQECLAKNLYRSACNRAWYAAMQIITAAAYEVLKDSPAQGKPTWDHDRQVSLFRSVLNYHKVWQENKALGLAVEIMRIRRNDCDYIAPQETHANAEAAKQSCETAGTVRQIIFKLMETRWDEHIPIASVGEKA